MAWVNFFPSKTCNIKYLHLLWVSNSHTAKEFSHWNYISYLLICWYFGGLWGFTLHLPSYFLGWMQLLQKIIDIIRFQWWMTKLQNFLQKKKLFLRYLRMEKGKPFPWTKYQATYLWNLYKAVNTDYVLKALREHWLCLGKSRFKNVAHENYCPA